jgi:hypothetical protein
MVRVCVVVLALAVALPASAQQLKLELHDGLVTLTAVNVPVRQILAEWAQVGGTRVVGAERISGAPLTLSLEGVPEGKALDIVLRGAAGYMAAARPVPGAGRSIYDRILVLATSTPPAGSGGPAAAGAGAANRPPAGRPFGVPTPTEETVSEFTAESPELPDAPAQNPFANAFGQPGAAGFGQPMPGVSPFGQQQAPPPGQLFQPGGSFFQPLQPPPQGAPEAAQGFFGSGGATTPGMIQQPTPPPGQIQQPGVRPRPQG